MIRALAAIACLASVAHAAPARVLVVHADDPADELRGLVARVRAELVALGFDVVLADREQPAPLAELAHDASAAAALRVGPPGAGVEVFAPAVSQVLLGSAGDDQTITLRAVELVRASLLEVAVREVPPAAELHAAAPPPPPAAPPHLAVELAPAIAIAPGGLGPTAQASFAARYRVTPAIEIGAGVLAPLSDATVSAAQGKASIAITAPTVEADYVARVGDFALRAGLGAGAAWLRMTGKPAADYVGRDASVTSALGFARGSIGRPLGPRVRLWLDTRLAIAAPRPVVVFAGDSVARWGRPAVIVALGLDLAVF
ncbi:MAG TPA: hypothetical protein VLX92_34840 [Kofleriaceae bacterium]|nr:hypothetical protein [Kofleriaceae bacterium]